MNPLKQTWRFLASLGAGLLATTDSPGTPFSEDQLADAAFALGRIVRLTDNDPVIDRTWADTIHKIAKDAHKKATE